MVRLAFLILSVFIMLALFATFHDYRALFLLGFALLLIAVGIYDFFQRKHTILRNYPLIGHLRFLFEYIRPEIQQYFIHTDQSGRPFNRESRSVIYARAKNELDSLPFGTQADIHEPGYTSLRHSMAPTQLPEEEGRVLVGGADCKKPYHASRLNISAMSYGALSKNAILALNEGAKLGDFAHNTGEGGLSPYHQAGGGDLIWQVGTANFGCRGADGRFDAEIFAQKASREQVKMIEIKLSQGAKPAHGGILPAAKITREIADIRGISMGEDCVSPAHNPEFSTPEELLYFVSRLRELSGFKPIGFKLCVGIRSEFLGICKAMLKTGILPDFITVDGAEGGTGAAPLEFSDYVGEPLHEGLVFVNNALVGIGVRDKIRVIASGKVATGMDMMTLLALGADLCNSARAMMMAVGCLQARTCNTNRCPAGVATQNPRLMRGLVVEDKSKRVAKFHEATIESLLDLAGAVGVSSLTDLGPGHIHHRVNYAESKTYQELFEFLQKDDLLKKPVPAFMARHWVRAQAEHF